MKRGLDLLAAALAVLALALSFGEFGGPVRSVILVAAFALAPGLALLRALRVDSERRTTTLALALALSPCALGFAMTILMLVGLDARTSARIALAAILVAFAADARRRRADAEGPPADLRAVALALVLTALCAWPLAASNRVRISIHGMLHASIYYAAVERGVPPENPFFAGQPLRYYWTWHLAIAAPCELGPIDPTLVFAASNVVALFAFLLLLGQLGAALFPAPWIAPLAVLLGFTCLDPLGAFLFESHARALGQAFLPLERLAEGNDVIHYIRALAMGDDERITATLTKFFNVSSFPHALALLVAAWLALLRCARSPSFASFLLLAATSAGCIALSPITGLAGGLALGVAVALCFAVALVRRDAAARRALLAAAAALIASVLIALPTVLLGGGDDEGTIAWRPTLDKLTAASLSLGPALLLALPAIAIAWRRRSGGDPGRRALAVAAPLLGALGVVLSFPVASEYKLVRMAAPLLGVFCAASLALLFERRPVVLRAAVCALVVGFFLPTNAIAWNAYRWNARASLPCEAEGTTIVVDELHLPIAAMYRWIRTQTPPDAVILDSPADRNFAGPLHGAEVPCLAHRPVYTDKKYYMTNFEKTFEQRLQLVRRVFSGAVLDAAEVARLKALARPLFVLVRDTDPSAAARTLLADRRFRVAHKTTSGYLFELIR